METKDPYLQQGIKLLNDFSAGSDGRELEPLAAKGNKLVKAQRGFIICDFIVHDGVSDESGNWHVGAMATLIDIIGTLTSQSVNAGSPMFTVDFCISYYSTVKVQDEVELEAKVIGKKGRLTSVVVEVRNKASAELIALAKLWMIPARSNTNHQVSKL